MSADERLAEGRQEIDGLRRVCQDLQKRVRHLEALGDPPEYFTREQAEAMACNPGDVAERIVGPEEWAVWSSLQRKNAIGLVKHLGDILADAEPGASVGLHMAGGQAHLWLREEEETP